MSSKQEFLSSEIDTEIKNFEFCWHQGQTAFQDGQRSAKKIFTLLKVNYGSLFSNNDIVKKMMNRLGHLNGISIWKLTNFIRDDRN